MEIKELQRLAEIKFTIGSLEAEAKEIQAKALQEMRDSNTEEIVAEGLGKLVLASKSKWSYPQEIVEAETQLKANKKAKYHLAVARYLKDAFMTLDIEHFDALKPYMDASAFTTLLNDWFTTIYSASK